MHVLQVNTVPVLHLLQLLIALLGTIVFKVLLAIILALLEHLEQVLEDSLLMSALLVLRRNIACIMDFQQLQELVMQDIIAHLQHQQ